MKNLSVNGRTFSVPPKHAKALKKNQWILGHISPDELMLNMIFVPEIYRISTDLSLFYIPSEPLKDSYDGIIWTFFPNLCEYSGYLRPV